MVELFFFIIPGGRAGAGEGAGGGPASGAEAARRGACPGGGWRRSPRRRRRRSALPLPGAPLLCSSGYTRGRPPSPSHTRPPAPRPSAPSIPAPRRPLPRPGRRPAAPSAGQLTLRVQNKGRIAEPQSARPLHLLCFRLAEGEEDRPDPSWGAASKSGREPQAQPESRREGRGRPGLTGRRPRQVEEQ